MKKLTTIILALILTMSMVIAPSSIAPSSIAPASIAPAFIAPAFAAERDGAGNDGADIPQTTITVDLDDINIELPDSGQLLEQYVEAKTAEQVAEESESKSDTGSNDAGGPALRKAPRANKLSSDEKIAYEGLLKGIKKIAAGETDSSVVTVSATEIEDISSLDYNKIFAALLSDVPYELYWYDKTKGASISVSSVRLVFYLKVAKAYSKTNESGTTDLDTARTKAASAAASNAASIIIDNESKSDYYKVKAYKEEICDLTSYNDAAAEDDDMPYGDPWQLIYVFDGDTSTEVVCEGYSKAFKFLCDQSEFNDSDICAEIASGYMDGGTGAGGHMWNILHMNDGKNYMVDVTNCDEGTIGSPDKLFLKGYASGDPDNGYIFKCIHSGRTYNVAYTYDESMADLFDTSELTLSAADYDVATNDELTINVRYHSPEDIISYINDTGSSLYDPNEYSIEPVINTVRGELSDKSKNSALRTLNILRYIAGLDPVTLDDSYGDKAQAAAFVNASLGKLTHSPKTYTKPEGMSDEDWDLGAAGAGASNLAAGLRTLNLSIRDWTYDEDSRNIDRLGHRRWCIDPKMGKTGFGAVGSYYAMYSFDSSGTGTQTNVAWPAHNMPVEYFNKNIPWSLSTGTAISDPSNVTVTLTRIADGKEWTFSGSETYSTTDAKYFNVDNQPYGQTGCIIFRPDDIDGYSAGDQFRVEITGAAARPIRYTVNFFQAIPMKGIRFSPDSATIAEGEWQWPAVYPYPQESIDEIDDDDVTYSSSDEAIASVSSSGVITGNAPGTAVITAEYRSMTAEFTITVKRSLYEAVKNSYTLTDPVYTGKPVSPAYELRDGDKILTEGTDYFVRQYDETIECDGQQHTIDFYGKGDYAAGIRLKYQVRPKPVTADMVDVSPEDFAYDGSAHAPELTLTYNDMTLAEGTDYTLTDVSAIDADTYSITITGKGNYTGTYQAQFTITPKALDESMLRPGTDELIYNGETQLPAFTVKDGSTTLEKGKDYTVTPVEQDDWKSAGAHQLTIKGIGNYTGSIDHAYTIEKAEHPLIMPEEEYDLPYSVSRLTNSILEDAADAGWSFSDEDLEENSALEVGRTLTCTLSYGGPDAANYEDLTAEVKVTRKPCSHDAGSITEHPAEDATCTEAGSSTYYQCESCGAYFSDSEATDEIAEDSWIIDALGHDYRSDGGRITTKPTCTEEGVRTYTYTCSHNSQHTYTETETVSAIGHDWDEGEVTLEPTCTEEGERTYTCRNDSGHTRTDPIDATGHQMKAVSAVAPTCEKDGNIAYWYCENCGKLFTDEDGLHQTTETGIIDPATGHDWDDGEVTLEPTCEGEGIYTYTCRNDNEHTYTEPIDALGHDWGPWEETEDKSTCIKAGQLVSICRNDPEHKQYKDADLLDHDMDHVQAVPPTCEEDGTIEYWQCSACGHVFADEKGLQELGESLEALPEGALRDPAFGHDYISDGGRITTEPTCTEDGVRTFTYVCSHDNTHTYTETEKLDALGHDWDEGTVTTRPTATKEGVLTYTCSRCGKTRTKAIPCRNKQYAADGTRVGPGASAEAAEKAITSAKSDKDPAGSTFGLLQVKSSKQTKTSVTVTWKKIKGAKKYVIYGNKCGSSNKMKKLTTSTGSTFTAKKIINAKGRKEKVKKGTYYKFIIVALDADRNVVSTSKVIHVSTKGGRTGNDKTVKTRAKKNKVTLKVSKTFKLSAKATPVSKKLTVKKHRAITYETSDKTVATVSSKGVIKGKKKGKCFIYAYAQNGTMARITVTVK